MTTLSISLMLVSCCFCIVSSKDYVKRKHETEKRETELYSKSLAFKYREIANQYMKICKDIESSSNQIPLNKKSVKYKQYTEAQNNYIFYLNLAEKIEKNN